LGKESVFTNVFWAALYGEQALDILRSPVDQLKVEGDATIGREWRLYRQSRKVQALFIEKLINAYKEEAKTVDKRTKELDDLTLHHREAIARHRAIEKVNVDALDSVSEVDNTLSDIEKVRKRAKTIQESIKNAKDFCEDADGKNAKLLSELQKWKSFLDNMDDDLEDIAIVGTSGDVQNFLNKIDDVRQKIVDLKARMKTDKQFQNYLIGQDILGMMDNLQPQLEDKKAKLTELNSKNKCEEERFKRLEEKETEIIQREVKQKIDDWMRENLVDLDDSKSFFDIRDMFVTRPQPDGGVQPNLGLEKITGLQVKENKDIPNTYTYNTVNDKKAVDKYFRRWALLLHPDKSKNASPRDRKLYAEIQKELVDAKVRFDKEFDNERSK